MFNDALFIIRLLTYLIVLFTFYGVSNNHGFNLKPNKLKVISTIVVALMLLPLMLW